MKINRIGSSMRWKLVFIYCLLVFIATTIIGVLIVSQLETYYMDTTKKNLTKTVKEGLLVSLNSYDRLSEHQEEIQANIDAWGRTIQEEIFVLDENFLIIASNNTSQGKSAFEILEPSIVYTSFLNHEISESYSKIVSSNAIIPVMNMSFPIGEKDNITGIVYMRADMTAIYDTINKSRQLFVQAMVIGLAITVVLGILIARSITNPINDVTQKAEKMVEGDFSQEVAVKSDDEIGRLADMFNLLRTRLDMTLFEMSSEKNKLETILRNMADGLIVVNLEGEILHINSAAMKMLKLPPEDAGKQSYDSVVRRLDQELSLEKLVEKCRDGDLFSMVEFREFIYSIRYDWLKTEDGEDAGIIILLQDVTERQKLENMQMDFVANVSHELKTPLTTIKSYTETMLSGYVDEEETRNEFLSIIDNEADRMNRLVMDLLQLSRLDNNQEILNLKEGNIISLLKSVVKRVEMTAASKKQSLDCLFAIDDKMNVDMDKDRIEQVLLNVLSNAIKYTQEGGKIRVNAISAGGIAEISVEDNGMGIPKNEQSRVFERFFRVDKARSRAMGGTGLGLAISKQIVEGHRGSIELESKEKVGTKVTIRLPLSVNRGISNIE